MKIQRNPHVNRSMIRTPAAFFGRRRELTRAAQRVAADPPQSVSIIGDRRIGKSSFLYYLSHPDITSEYLDEPERTLFLFMDFQEERRLSIEGFFQSLARHLRDELGDRHEIPEDLDEEGIARVMEGLGGAGYRVILLLDEFDRVTRSSSFDESFFARLRSLAGHQNIAYVTSSSRDLQQLCHTQEIADSPFFNVFSTLHLGPMLREEALELIQEPTAGGPFPLEPHTDLILELGGRWPFFLQIASSAVFEMLVEEGECNRDRVCERFLEEASPHFQFYWEQMDAVSRAICNDLACNRDTDVERKEYRELARRGVVLEEGQLFSVLFGDFAREAYAREVGEEPVEVQAQRARSMEEELNKARDMQTGLLPQKDPDAEGLEFAGRLEPASEVGGDFYNHLWLDNDRRRLAVVAVDVMGHGMEAAVTAMRFSETLRYEALGRRHAADIMAGLNRSLEASLTKGFVGCCIAVFDLDARDVEVVVGGYHPPLHYIRSQDQVVEPEVGNLPLGVNATTTYEACHLSLEEGDVVLIYSDGVVEAQDEREAMYGVERLQELVREEVKRGATMAALLDRLFWDVGRFTASVGQDDDITAIAVRVV